jgi:prolyl oligopeptidase
MNFARRTPLLLLLLSACAVEPTVTPREPMRALQPPPDTKMTDQVDDYHGTLVSDPYRWLEDQDGEEVLAWTRQQNAVTRDQLDRSTTRPQLVSRLTELWNYERFSAPTRAGQRWFYRKNDGLQNQSVLYVSDAPNGAGEVLLDPNTLSEDGTVALASTAFDERGKRMAYSISRSGSDWREWRVLDIDTKAPLPDVLEWSKFSGAAWTHDGEGFFYQRYPAPKQGETYEAQTRQPQLCYHRLGDAQADDRVVYERSDQPDWGFNPYVTDDGRFLIVTISLGTDQRTRIAYVDLQNDAWHVEPLLMAFDAAYEFLGNDGDTFFFSTNHSAPRGRIIALNRSQPDVAGWQEIVAQQPNRLDSAAYVGGVFVCGYLEDASSRIRKFGADGSALGDIGLPTLGTARGFTGDSRSSETFFTFNSFTQPPRILRHDLGTSRTTDFRVPAFPRGDDDLVTRRVFLQSADGTRLCMFLVHKRGLRLDGSSPCYLWGYGGFDISVPPRFSVPNLVWVERGGIYAQAILRGGGEYGESWHEAGMLGNKQNVFDDFVACSDYLVRNGYTSNDRLALGGRSNGGLLVGAVLTQRPDLMGAAIPEVGVLDMLRYHEFTIGWAWAPEYGRSDDAEQFAWLYRYSPLHNIAPDAVYPPTMIMTSDHDDRVLPGHSYKFAAALQQAQGGEAPILLRVESNAGHGAGTPIHKLIDEAADRWAFLDLALRR